MRHASVRSPIVHKIDRFQSFAWSIAHRDESRQTRRLPGQRRQASPLILRWPLQSGLRLHEPTRISLGREPSAGQVATLPRDEDMAARTAWVLLLVLFVLGVSAMALFSLRSRLAPPLVSPYTNASPMMVWTAN